MKVNNWQLVSGAMFYKLFHFEHLFRSVGYSTWTRIGYFKRVEDIVLEVLELKGWSRVFIYLFSLCYQIDMSFDLFFQKTEAQS